jgi:hypothetical protein
MRIRIHNTAALNVIYARRLVCHLDTEKRCPPVFSKYISYRFPSITWAIGKGGPRKSILFWALKWQRAKLMYIKLPMYLFFYMTLGLDDLDEGQSITWAIGRGGP